MAEELFAEINLSKTKQSCEGVTELFVKEQFITASQKDLAVHLQERAPKDLEKLAQLADHF